MRPGFHILLFFLTFLFIGSYSPNSRFTIPDFENEAMHYIVKYGMFYIGEADIIFRDDSIPGEFYIQAEARSSGFVRLFKRLNYFYDSHMDPMTGLSREFTMRLRDNRNYYYNRMTFDRESREDSTIVESHLSGIHVVPNNIHDILTGFHDFRENRIPELVKSGHDIVIKTYFIDRLWDLQIRYDGKERLNTKFGKINCIILKPVTVIGDFFKNDDDMTMWVSDDANHLPLRIRLNLTLGTIDGYLVDYRNPEQRIRF